MTWSKVFTNPNRVREMPLPGGPPPEVQEAMQAVHAQLEGLTKSQAIGVLRTVLEQVRRNW